MSREKDAEQLLKEGLYPFQIAERMGISVKSVIGYLCKRVGYRALLLSDLYFSYPKDKRDILKEAAQGKYPDKRFLNANGLSLDDYELFHSLVHAQVFSGDIYDYVSRIEIIIHRFVEDCLKREFGADENGWWRKGIKENIRQECAKLRESDKEPCESPYQYTTLINLSEIIDKNWKVFEDKLPKVYRANKKKLEEDFYRLNRIRNSVMHPVKQRKWSEDDFVFVREMSGLFETTV